MVPMDQPPVALDMIEEFIRNKSIEGHKSDIQYMIDNIIKDGGEVEEQDAQWQSIHISTL